MDSGIQLRRQEAHAQVGRTATLYGGRRGRAAPQAHGGYWQLSHVYGDGFGTGATVPQCVQLGKSQARHRIVSA